MVKKGLSLSMPGVDIDVDAALAEKAGAVAVPAKEEKSDSTPAVKEVKIKPKRNTKKEVKEVDDFSVIFAPKQEKELRNVAVNLRVKKSVKENFDMICKRLGRSQSDMLEFWVDLTLRKITAKYKD